MRCGVTKKIAFKSHEAALMRGGEILTNESKRKYTPNAFRAYKCQFCGFFHLSAVKERYNYTPQQEFEPS